MVLALFQGLLKAVDRGMNVAALEIFQTQCAQAIDFGHLTVDSVPAMYVPQETVCKAQSLTAASPSYDTEPGTAASSARCVERLECRSGQHRDARAGRDSVSSWRTRIAWCDLAAAGDVLERLDRTRARAGVANSCARRSALLDAHAPA